MEEEEKKDLTKQPALNERSPYSPPKGTLRSKSFSTESVSLSQRMVDENKRVQALADLFDRKLPLQRQFNTLPTQIEDLRSKREQYKDALAAKLVDWDSPLQRNLADIFHNAFRPWPSKNKNHG